MQGMKKKRDIELLAPAGGMEQFYAAINNGADAVYLGGAKFNARIGAGNFSIEEIEMACDYAHLRRAKVYVTMNTLMDDSDLPEALSFACTLYRIGVDALIIQDIGLGELIHAKIPDFELHLSTQATSYNYHAVEAARELGYSRVVLARECTLEEIKSCCGIIAQHSLAPQADTQSIKPQADAPLSPTEIEVFVHGAMCFCYSGQCQLSRYIGGRSGNKGMCAQPCRLPYEFEGKSRKKAGFLLSPKDLCYIDRLGELIDAGVTSLKIEGRMKSKEYVATVVRIYRKYIDEYLSKGKYTVSDEDRFELAQIFNRGGFTEGYLHEDPEEDFMSGRLPKNEGVPVGKVIGSRRNGLLAEVLFDIPIKMGDVIEIHSRETFSLMVTYLEKKGEAYLVGDMKDDIHPGDEVYRIISSDLMRKANNDVKRKSKVDMDLYAFAGSPLRLNARACKESISMELDDFEIELAKKKATTEEEIKAQLIKTGDTPFEAGKIGIHMKEEVFIPGSKLNELRREALIKLEKRIKSACKHYDWTINQKVKEVALKPKLEPFETMTDVVILPQITKGSFDEWIEKNKEKLSGKKVIVHNISWIKPLANIGTIVIGGWGLNITNGYSALAYKKLGMSDEYYLSLETFEKDKMEGKPLMITQHRLEPGILTDRKGAKYAIEYNEVEHKSYIFGI